MTDPTRDATPNAAPSKICPRHGLPFDPTKARGCTRCYEEARARAAQKKAAAAGAATPAPAATATVQTVRTPLPKTWPAQPQPVSVLCQRHAQPFDPTKHRGCAKCYEEARARAAQKKAAQGAPQPPVATAAPQAPQAPPASPATQASTTPAAPAPAATATVQTVRTPLPKTWPAQSQPVSVLCQRHEQTFDPTKVRGCPKCYEEARARAAQKKAAQQAPPQPASTAPPEAVPSKPSGLPPLPSPVSSEAKADATQSGLQTVSTPLPRTWPPRAEPVSVRCQRHEQIFDPTKVRGCPKCYEEARARAAQKKAAQEAAARGEAAPPVAEPAPASSSSMPFYEIARPSTPPAEETEAAGTPSYQLAQPPPPPPPGTPEAPTTADASPQAAEPGATAPRPPRPPRPRPVRRPPPPPKTSVAQGLWAAVLLIAFTGFGLLLKHQAIYDETQAFMNAPYEDDWENGGLSEEELQELPPEVRELLETNGYVDDDYSYEYYEEE